MLRQHFEISFHFICENTRNPILLWLRSEMQYLSFFQFPFLKLSNCFSPRPSLLCWSGSVSQWCSWAVRSTPQKTASMLSSRSMAAVTTPPPTVRGPSSSLMSREKASKRLLTGAQGSKQLFVAFRSIGNSFFFPNQQQADNLDTSTTKKYKIGESLKCLEP